MNSGKIFSRYSPRFQRIIVIVDCHIQCYNDVIRLLTVVFLQLWGLSSLKRWQEVMVGVPKLVFKFFYREIHFSKLVKQRKKRLHLFSSVSVTQVSVIYSIFIIFRPILQEVLPVEQQAFSHHFLSIIQLSVGLTDIVLYINCLWPAFVTIAI